MIAHYSFFIFFIYEMYGFIKPLHTNKNKEEKDVEVMGMKNMMLYINNDESFVESCVKVSKKEIKR